MLDFSKLLKGRLSKRDYRIVQLRFVNRLSHREIAGRVNLSHRGVGKALVRSIKEIGRLAVELGIVGDVWAR